MASRQPGFLANLVDAKLLWSIATYYPKKNEPYVTGVTIPRQDPLAPPTDLLLGKH